jgi:hypothetical protein
MYRLNVIFMIHLIFEGNEYDAPFEEVWKMAEALTTNAVNEIHPDTRHNKSEWIDDNSVIQTFEGVDRDGHSERGRMKMTLHHPVGVFFEVLAGPFNGSRFFKYYIPAGKKTGETVVGEFRSSVISEDKLRQIVPAFLQRTFEAEQNYLSKKSR